MNRLAREVLAQRADRNAAKARLDSRVAWIRAELEERGLAGRMADTVQASAQEAMDEAVLVAGESKGVIAGTAALLALWFLRNPIITWVEHTLRSESEFERQDQDEHE